MTKRPVLAALVICAGAWVAPTASEQPADDCQPSALNIPGAAQGRTWP